MASAVCGGFDRGMSGKRNELLAWSWVVDVVSSSSLARSTSESSSSEEEEKKKRLARLLQKTRTEITCDVDCLPDLGDRRAIPN